MRKLKKAFTIVELVIVIAVIAILAAVLIPTFVGIVKKANLSADQQVARTLDLALQLESAESQPEDMGDVCNLLKAEGYNFATMKPKTGDCIYVWDKASNKILLMNLDGTVVFPEGATTADVHVLIGSQKDFDTYATVADTYALGTSLKVSGALDIGGKTLDLNSYTLDVDDADTTITAGTVTNGFVTEAADTLIAAVKTDSVQVIAVVGSSAGSDLKTLTAQKDYSVKDGVLTVSNLQFYLTEASAVLPDARKATNGNNVGFKLNSSILITNVVLADDSVDSVVIENCVFDGSNLLYITNFNEVTVRNCIFRSSNGGGPLAIWSCGEVTVEGCSFETERGIQISAAESNYANYLLQTTSVTVRDNYFSITRTNPEEIKKTYAVQFAGSYYSDDFKATLENNTFALCYGVVRLHENLFTGKYINSDEKKYNAESAGYVQAWASRSWITLKNNTYGSEDILAAYPDDAFDDLYTNGALKTGYSEYAPDVKAAMTAVSASIQRA